jgi:type IV pilus assembly protein PilQ
MKLLLTILTFLFITVTLVAQDKYTQLQQKLINLSNGDIPALNESVNISVTNVPIQEFIRGIATSAALNINVDPGLKIDVVNNFSNVKVVDILLFLCKQYGLEISVYGNIINISKAKEEQVLTTKKVFVNFDIATQALSIQCDNEELGILAKEIVDQTGKNVIPASGLDKVKVSGYIQKMPIDNALDKLTYANNLKVKKTEDNVYLIEKNDPIQESEAINKNSEKQYSKKNLIEKNEGANVEIKVVENDSLSVISQGASIKDIIEIAANQLKIDYFFTSEIKGESSFILKRTSFPSLLEYLFRNTVYTFQIKNGVFIIGDNKSREMKDFRVIQVQNRTIEKLLDVIPNDIKADIDLKEFVELNALLACGLPESVDKLEMFIRSVDKLVPVVLIEVMIIDSKKSRNVSTGIEAGVGDKPVKTKGTIFPGIDMSISSQSINNLLNSFNGYGAEIIGHVSPNFYMTLKILENDGVIDIRSTPKLSTLNGHEANISIGNTQYYREEQNNIYGSLSSQSQTITSYKSVEAKLSVKIRPIVSGDDQITLEIEVKQEDFTDRIEKFAPPGKVSREFKSLIRVKDQDMILLGGLEEKREQNLGAGVPFLSRIPVIKWLFSSRTNSKSKSKLNIFIKPTILN